MNTVHKFHGAGNDFILIDMFDHENDLPEKRIKQLCDRHFGIGADGLIIIKKSDTAAFKMVYFNSDGKEAEMCGNGARCAFAFSYSKDYCKKEGSFEASDGIHQGVILSDSAFDWLVKITLHVSASPKQIEDGSYFVNTGVPHNVRILDDIESLNVRDLGAELRNNLLLFPNGANINFISIKKEGVFIRTYERGVEDETLACGTGVTASALVAHQFFGLPFPVTFYALGGTLSVDKQRDALWLEGPAKHVFTSTFH